MEPTSPGGLHRFPGHLAEGVTDVEDRRIHRCGRPGPHRVRPMDPVRGVPAFHGGREAGPPTRRHHPRMDCRDQGHRAIVAGRDHGAGAGRGHRDGAPRAAPRNDGRVTFEPLGREADAGSPSSSTSSRRIRSRRPGTRWASSSVRWRVTSAGSRSSSSRAGRRPAAGVVRSRAARRWAPAAEPRGPCKGRQADGTDDRDVLGAHAARVAPVPLGVREPHLPYEDEAGWT